MQRPESMTSMGRWVSGGLMAAVWVPKESVGS